MTLNGSTSPPSPAADPLAAPLPGARTALILLLSINLFNYIDRYMLAAMEPHISEEFFPKGSPREANAGFWMGLLATAFMVFYLATAPLFGWLAERSSRWLLVGIGVILWSLASGASGLAPVFIVLLLTRCFVGIGEAAYGPVAPTVISDLYPVKVRGSVLSWFYAAIPVGSALGYALGDIVVKMSGDWRLAFFLVVPPGLLLGVWCFFMPEPQRGQADTPGQAARKTQLSDYLVLLHTPSYVLDTLGMTAMAFAMGGLSFWVPRYLLESEVKPLWGIEPVTLFGGFTALAGLLATLLGGIVGDRLRPRFSGAYFLVSGIAMILAFPCILLMLYVPFPLAWVFLVLAVFLLFFNTGPTNTILANVTHPLIRAQGFAINIFVIHVLGDAISPPIIGAIKDASNLTVAFQVVSAMAVVGGLLWLWGMRYLEKDTALAPKRLESPAA
jgi:MFS family permease